MVQKLTLNYLAIAPVDIPAVSMPITCSLKTYVALCCVTFYCTCVMIMLFNQLLDMPHLSGGCILLAKEKCLQTEI